jgi:predicted nucleic acid-binding protein
MAGVTRLVLDTNVWLDWLVFDEPALAPLRAAQAAGRVEIVMDEACEAELARVLAYDLGRHTIDAKAHAACLERCRGIARRVAVPGLQTASPTEPASGAATGAIGGAARTPVLPHCSDPHDQKFLELALGARADVLVTKDQALLDLARRKLPFRIAAPSALGAL